MLYSGINAKKIQTSPNARLVASSNSKDIGMDCSFGSERSKWIFEYNSKQIEFLRDPDLSAVVVTKNLKQNTNDFRILKTYQVFQHWPLIVSIGLDYTNVFDVDYENLVLEIVPVGAIGGIATLFLPIYATQNGSGKSGSFTRIGVKGTYSSLSPLNHLIKNPVTNQTEMILYETNLGKTGLAFGLYASYSDWRYQSSLYRQQYLEVAYGAHLGYQTK
jgi:hypothetical protein